MAVNKTPFSAVYDCFLSKVTDDMYMELTVEETEGLLQDFLLNAIPYFEFPRKNIADYSIDNEEFNVELDQEEINILATYMAVEWLGQQLVIIDNVRQKYSGTDFKFTSQANHMGQVSKLVDQYKTMGFHLQRLYKRREVNEEGEVLSTMSQIMGGK